MPTEGTQRRLIWITLLLLRSLVQADNSGARIEVEYAFSHDKSCGSAYSCDPVLPIPTSLPLIETNKSSTNTTQPRAPPIVITKYGAVDGYFEKVISGRSIYSFRGIPYAEPPIGNNRFRSPVPKAAWNGIRQAKSQGSDCLQLNMVKLLRVLGSEDCLFLNIHTPEIATSEQKPNFPVLIFMHGGNFNFGAGWEYGPAYLLQKDIVLVTINYRLSILGFLSTGDEESPGNYGLKDQALAIKWVSENIENFGGDPNRITLMGQSAGAASAHLHMLSTTSVAKGLFHAAISQSGSAFHHWGLSTTEFAIKITHQMAKIVKCPVNHGSKVLMECFRSRNANFLTGLQNRLPDFFQFPFSFFTPTIEPNITGAFLIDTPENYYARNEVAKIPWISSTTQEESEFVFVLLRNLLILENYVHYFKEYSSTIFDFGRRINNSLEVSEILLESYLGNRDPKTVHRSVLAQVATDRFFTIANRRALKYHYKIAPTYSYIFGFTSPAGIVNRLHSDHKNWGSPHGEDLSIIFNSTFFFKPIERNEPAFELSNIMINLLNNFATKGEPLYTDENGKEQIIWNPITDPDDLQFLRLNYGDIKMISDPFKERIKVWDKLGIT